MTDREIITLKNDYYFPFQLRIMAWLGIIMGVALIIGGSIIFGIILLPMSLFFGLAKSGVQLNVANEQFRNLPFVFRQNTGWKSLDTYSYVTILSSKSTTDSYDLYLNSKDHQDKLLLKRFKTKRDAQQELENLASRLKLISLPQLSFQ
jgi:ribosomal protein L33